MKTLLLITLSKCFLLLITLSSFAQIEGWNDVVEQAVLNHGDEGEWDDRQVWNPAVIKDGDTLRMYYLGGNEIVWESAIGGIGYAWSIDGINWTRYIGNPVLSADLEWEEDNVVGCAVIKDNDSLKMWYCCGSEKWVTGYATSTDGKNWNKHPSPVLSYGPLSDWDAGFVFPTTVIKDGNLYKMWYWAGRPGWPYKESMPQSGLATSTDGINWIKYNDTMTGAPFIYSDPVLKHGSNAWDEDRVIFPMVLKKGSGYEAWYAGARWAGLTGQHIGYAQSDDGINWEKHPEPVFTSPRSWGSTIYGGSVVAFDDYYHLWYACFTAEIEAGPAIGYAWTNTSGIGLQHMKTNVQLYPNPFTTSTTLSYELKQPETVHFNVYNQLGQLVYQHSVEQQQGSQQLQWDAQDQAEGIYYYQLQAGEQVSNGKMVKVK